MGENSDRYMYRNTKPQNNYVKKLLLEKGHCWIGSRVRFNIAKILDESMPYFIIWVLDITFTKLRTFFNLVNVKRAKVLV